jgi:hypothetical protein
MPHKNGRAKHESSGSISYLVEKGGKEKCWKWNRPHEKKYYTLIHHMPKPLTLTPTSHVPIVMHIGMRLIIASHFTQSYKKANHKTPMLIRPRFGKVQSIR